MNEIDDLIAKLWIAVSRLLTENEELKEKLEKEDENE